MKAKFFITLGLLLAVLATIATFGIYMETANASSTNSITANVAVSNVIYLSVANAIGGNTINFGSLFTLNSYDANVPVTDTNNGGNIGANILVSGTSWALTSNTAVTFPTGNTLWNPTSLTSYAGNALTTSFVNTNDIIVAPTLSSSITSNSIYFGLSIPAGTASGNYVQTISFENYNASQSIYNSISTANAITAMVDVQGTCYIALSTNTISFGSIVSSANVPTNVLVTDTDNGGNAASTLLVGGNDWTQTASPHTTFGVSRRNAVVYALRCIVILKRYCLYIVSRRSACRYVQAEVYVVARCRVAKSRRNYYVVCVDERGCECIASI